MKNIKLEKNIPIPSKRIKANPKNKRNFPFIEMKVGDSFFAENNDNVTLDVFYKRIATTVSHFKNTLKIKLTIRKYKENNGIRIWRIK